MRARLGIVFPTLLVGVLGSFAGSTACTKKPTASTPATSKGGVGTAPTSDIGSEGGAVGFLQAKPKACMFHMEAKGYFKCLSGADGQCFHYGAMCSPDDSCMVDATSGQTKNCTEQDEGECVVFKELCQQKNTCQFSVEERRYKTCTSPAVGGCKAFGSVCNPN